jgi:O-methyltransferase involved in polyketide biosynthesis
MAVKKLLYIANRLDVLNYIKGLIMPSYAEQADVSSAEFTAIYRSALPALSGDTLSKELASPAGKEKAQAFIDKYAYPLVNRKISLRAGYFLAEASALINSGNYDACISLASGFSLLSYYIAQQTTGQSGINYFDTDLSHMLNERNSRIKLIKQQLDQTILAKIHTKAFDIEQAYQQNANLRELFPDCDRPLFMAEGISYFLSQGCTHWLLEQLACYRQSAIIFDYWPDNMLQISSLFARTYQDLKQGSLFPEQIQTYWSAATLTKISQLFPFTTDWSLTEADQVISSLQTPGLKPQLVNPNQYFPLRLLTSTKIAIDRPLYPKPG